MPHRHGMPCETIVVGHAHRTGLPGASSVKIILTTSLIAALLAWLVAAFPGSVGAHADTVCDKFTSKSGSTQRLVDSLASGQVGCLRGGTYTAGADGSLTMRKGTTLRSAPNERATLNARIYVPEEADRVMVRALTIKGTPGKSTVLIRGDDTRWLNNAVTNGHRHSSCFFVGSDDRVPSTGTVIRNNRIHDCGKLPRTHLDHGIYVSDARGTRIIDNRIYGNADRGVQLYPSSQGTLIEGNVISANGQGIVFDGSSSNNTVRGNVLVNPLGFETVGPYNVYAAPKAHGSHNLVARNCLWRPNGTSGLRLDSSVFAARNNVVAKPSSTLCRSVL